MEAIMRHICMTKKVNGIYICEEVGKSLMHKRYIILFMAAREKLAICMRAESEEHAAMSIRHCTSLSFPPHNEPALFLISCRSHKNMYDLIIGNPNVECTAFILKHKENREKVYDACNSTLLPALLNKGIN
jgi:hypothetical protein